MPKVIGNKNSGCQSCRDLHLKCDQKKPKCSTCERRGLQCRKQELKFRFAKGREFSFAHAKWVQLPKRISFQDESDGEQDEEEEDDDEDDDGWPADSPVGYSQAIFALSPAPSARFIPHEQNAALPDPVQLGPAAQPSWPLTNVREAMLFRHYVRELAAWLDLCDPRRSFETIVPARAGASPVLLKAILAFAARHQTNTHAGDYDDMACSYQRRCLEDVIAMLRHKEARADENLLAATIILRVVQEMEVTNYGVDNQSYLSVIADFVKDFVKDDRYIASGGLCAAAYWVGLRQEIYMAVMESKSIRINFVSSLVNRSLTEADEFTWANRAVVHCADVLNLSFGSTQPPSRTQWTELDEWNKMWLKNLPISCQPVYYEEWDEHPGTFPRIWYHSSCHVIGAQHHILARLLLLRHDPSFQLTGSAQRMAISRKKHRMRQLVRDICGIALDNQWSVPSMFTACMAIATFGDCFQSHQDQKALLAILERTEQEHARPTETVRRKMMNQWGWPTLPSHMVDGL